MSDNIGIIGFMITFVPGMVFIAWLGVGRFIVLILRSIIQSNYGVYMPLPSKFTTSITFDTASHENSIEFKGNRYFLYEDYTTGRVYKAELWKESQINSLFPMNTYADWLDSDLESTYVIKTKISHQSEAVNMTDIQDLNLNDICEKHSVLREEQAPSTKLKVSDTKQKPNIMELDPNAAKEVDITEQLTSERTTVTLPSLLKTVKHNPKPRETKKKFTNGTCTICLEPFAMNDKVRGLFCGHVFHQNCIDTWLTTRAGSCPICRRNIRLSAYDFKFDDVISIPFCNEPGLFELDMLFKLHINNSFSFFLVMIITRVKAQLLLIALMKLRNNNVLPEALSIPEFEEKLSHVKYNNRITEMFKQKNDDNSFDQPPLPNMNNLNPYLKKIVENDPFPIDSGCLVDLDHKAWKRTQRDFMGPKRIIFSFASLSKLHVYYYHVIAIYEERQKKGLKEVAPEP